MERSTASWSYSHPYDLDPEEPFFVMRFGVREGSHVVLLGPASIGVTDATLISLLSVAAVLLAGLPGARLLARKGLTLALESMPSVETVSP